MKIQLPREYFKTQVLLPLISYKDDPTLSKTPTEKSESPKFYINTQPGYRDIDTLAIYVPLFRTGSPEALLKFFTILNKIIRYQDLFTGSQKFGMTRNLVIGESLQVFEQKA